MKDVNDLFTVRSALEALAAELATQRMTPEELDLLEAKAAIHYTPSEAMTVETFVMANEEFHRMIASASGIARLASSISAYLAESTRLMLMGALMRDVNPETITDHTRIVVALRRRDAAAARKAIVEHTEHTRLGILDGLIANSQSTLSLQ